MPRPLIKTNSQALRWCRTRRADISFNNWKDIANALGIPRECADFPCGVSCRVSINKKDKFGRTLTKAVNAWIQTFNEQEKK